MSVHPTPVVGLSWESATGQTTDLQGDAASVLVAIVEGLDETPEVRPVEDTVPFLPGRLRRASVADRRAIVLSGYVVVSDDAGYRPIVNRLQRAMDPTVGAGTLTATLEDGGVRTIEAVPVDLLWEGTLRRARLVSIELDADPHWRGVEWGSAWTLDMGLSLDEGLYLDMPAGPVTLVPDGADPCSDTFGTLGTTATLDAVIEVVGPSAGPVTVANADGIGFGFPALSTGETLVVDAGLKTALLDDVQARASLSLLTPNPRGQWFRVRPGSDTFTVTGAPARVTVAFRPSY